MTEKTRWPPEEDNYGYCWLLFCSTDSLYKQLVCRRLVRLFITKQWIYVQTY